MREPNLIEKRWDESYMRSPASCPIHKLVVRIFRKHINRVICTVILRAYERGQLESAQLHAILGIVDRVLYPKNS
jgi:hypothetical protein